MRRWRPRSPRPAASPRPDVRRSPTWDVLVDTGGQLVGRAPVEPGTAITLESRSLVVLREHRERPVGADRTVAPAL